ncbi:MAG TPA: NADH-quinone oxidoreductase subunit J [Syntrophales bacterium]|nr:NADH-quinone oxidoreductase subunit J [Syntrophales bacterium]
MTYAFYIASAIAIAATVRVITGTHAIHALLYLVVSFLAVAMIFLILGAPFAAALEVIVYAGAVLVLFVFVMMMLNPGPRSVVRERRWLTPEIWVGPVILTAVLLAELIWVMTGGGVLLPGELVSPKRTGASLFGPYILGVEMASVLLLAGLVGAYHLAHDLGRRREDEEEGGSRQ